MCSSFSVNELGNSSKVKISKIFEQNHVKYKKKIPCFIFRENAEKWLRCRAYRPNKVDFGPKKDDVFPVNRNNREFARGDACAPDYLPHHYSLKR